MALYLRLGFAVGLVWCIDLGQTSKESQPISISYECSLIIRQWYNIFRELLEASREVPTVSLLHQAEQCQGVSSPEFYMLPRYPPLNMMELSRIHCPKNTT
jgi:hypothetical protein